MQINDQIKNIIAESNNNSNKIKYQTHQNFNMKNFAQNERIKTASHILVKPPNIINNRHISLFNYIRGY